MVIADTAPLNYLLLIDAIDVLPRLYGRVAIPKIVHAELQAARTPVKVSRWAAHLPPWIEVYPTPDVLADDLTYLDAGERAAIQIAREQPPPVLLLIDEMAGRTAAERHHIPIVGTLGVLREAAALDWIDLSATFTRLRVTTFHAPVSLMNDLLAQDARRKRKP